MRRFVVLLVVGALAGASSRAHAEAPGSTPTQAVVEIESASGKVGTTRASRAPANSISGRVVDGGGNRSRPPASGRGPKGEARRKALRSVDAVRWHIVQKGQRLGSIAKRYAVTLDALLAANELERRDKLKPGERLIIPGREDVDGSVARRIRAKTPGIPLRRRAGSDTMASDPLSGASAERWRAHAKRPRRKGVVTLIGHEGEFTGRILDKRGGVRVSTLRRLSRVTGEGAELDPELLAIVVRISDTFGGRAIHLVSAVSDEGERESGLHRSGRAIDFAIEQVPIDAVRDFCRTLEGVGVGLHSSGGYLHLDVRDRRASWSDSTRPTGKPDDATVKDASGESQP